MHRIAEGIEEGSDVAIDRGIVVPDIGHGKGEVFGKGARPIYADTLGMGTEMPPTRQAIAAPATDDMPLATDDFAGKEIGYVRSHFNNLADELMANHHRHRYRLAGPGVPFVDVDVGSENPRPVDFDEHVVHADLGHRHVFEPQSRLCFALDQCFHRGHHLAPRGLGLTIRLSEPFADTMLFWGKPR